MISTNLRSGMGVAVCVAGLALGGSMAFGQAYPIESQLRFEVWDGSTWASSVVAQPGGRVEVRAVVSYTGPNTAVLGLGSLLYQPVFSNWDNDGASQDDLGSWRNGGVGGDGIANSMLTASEGASGAALATYGRVGFGAQRSQSSTFSTITNHRHAGGSSGAPQGSFLRAAGAFATQWPQLNPPAWTIEDSNRITTGMSARQLTRVNPRTGLVNPFWTGGTTDIVIFRQAVLLSDMDVARTISISSEEAFLEREQFAAGTTDNRRFMSWWTQEMGGSVPDYRSGVEFVSASIHVVPSPAAGVAMVAFAGLLLTRRRERCR
ncbi:MAG: hypothetical protein ACK5ZG_14720 [Phycisphaerae bacterium]|jgi:hypothetical protein